MSDQYEDQPFVWSEAWTSDDIREMTIARFDRIFRERHDKAKKPRPLDTIGEMEMEAIDAFSRAFDLRMRGAKILSDLGRGLEVPRQ